MAEKIEQTNIIIYIIIAIKTEVVIIVRGYTSYIKRG